MRQKVIFNHFNRLGKLLLFHLLQNENFEVVGIISPFSAKEIATLLNLDSNHGKFWGQFINQQQNEEKTILSFNFANQKQLNLTLYDSKSVDQKLLKKLNADIIINLDPSLKHKALLEWTTAVNRYVISELSTRNPIKNDIEPIVFGFNHTKISKNRSKLIYISAIETTILVNLIRKFSKKIKIDTCHFSIWSGPSNNEVFLDEIVQNGKNFAYMRSAFNNILPVDVKELLVNLELIQAKNRYETSDPIIFRGQKMVVPVRGSAFLEVCISMHEIHDQKELKALMQESSDSLIALNESMFLTSQDITSTNHFAVLDQNLVKFLMTNQNKLMKVGLWYDPESSHAISIVKTLEFLAN